MARMREEQAMNRCFIQFALQRSAARCSEVQRAESAGWADAATKKQKSARAKADAAEVGSRQADMG